MANNENLKKVQKLFGAPLGHFPEIYPEWDGPKGTAFWASSMQWNSMMLRSESSCAFRWFPLRKAETVPFTVKPENDGFLIFVED